MDAAAIESALEKVRPALASDGFRLSLGNVKPSGAIEIILEALPGACLDCLVPDEILIQIVASAVHDEGATVGRIELEKRGFDHPLES